MEQLNVKFPGKEIVLDGQTYIMPKLGLNAYAKHGAFDKIQRLLGIVKDLLPENVKLQDLAGANIYEVIPQLLEKISTMQVDPVIFEDILELIFLALKRNYKDFDFDMLEELDLVEALKLMPALLITNQGQNDEVKKIEKNGKA